jgi:hypothetical protein
MADAAHRLVEETPALAKLLLPKEMNVAAGTIVLPAGVSFDTTYLAYLSGIVKCISSRPPGRGLYSVLH